MKFNPKYTITQQLLSNISGISQLIGELKSYHLTKTAYFELETDARAVSSYASTSIEGNPLPLTQVRKILKQAPQNIHDTEREVLNYNKALEELNNLIDTNKSHFNLKLILQIHKTVTTKLLYASQTGAIRNLPIVVNNPKTGQTVYWPPDIKDVKPLLDELLEFVKENRGKIYPLILAGIFHKQFVIIHPFVDGNGRTCRLATKALLAEMDINAFNLFSFENYYNRNVTKYFHEVGEYNDYYDNVKAMDFTSWLEYFTAGILDEMHRVIKEIDNIQNIPASRLNDDQNNILKYIRENGLITDSDYSTITKRKKATRVLDFNKLIAQEKIVRKGSGRQTYYTIS